MRSRTLRAWSAAAAAALFLLFGALLWTSRGPHTPTDLLRAAFDHASASCYQGYRGEALRACLAGVMTVHLQALGAIDRDGGTEAAGPAVIRPDTPDLL